MIYYIPAAVFTLFYGIVAITDSESVSSVVTIWIILMFISGLLLHRKKSWGSFIGILPSFHLIYMGTQNTGQIINEIIIGIIILIYYLACGYYVYRKHGREKSG